MIHWIIPALVAPFINAIVNFVDKYLVSNRVRNYRALILYSTSVNFAIGAAAWAIAGFPIVGPAAAFYALASGFVLAVSTFLYFYMASKEEMSSVILMFQLVPVFVLVMAYFFLNEQLTAIQGAGFALILFAALMLSFNRPLRAILSWRLIVAAFFADLFLAGSAILINKAIDSSSFFTILGYQGFGMGIAAIFFYSFFPNIRAAFWENYAARDIKAYGLIIMNEGLTVTYEWIAFFAYSIGPAALVSVAGGAQAFFGIVIGIILTLLFPNIVKEDISKENLLPKIIAAFILIIGLYLVYL